MPYQLRASPFVRGLGHSAGAAMGYLPVAAAFGAIAASAGMSGWVSLLMSAWIYAGAAQMAGLQALALGQHPLLVALGMLVVNLRHVPMSLAIAPVFHRVGRRDRLALAQTLTDEAFALDLQRPDAPVGFYYGIHVSCWLAWVAGTVGGAAVGPVIPGSWTAFALPALFIALAVDALGSIGVRHRWWVTVAGLGLVILARLTGPFAALAAMASLTVLLAAADRRWSLAMTEAA